jgi:hypothetical protein
MALGEEEERVWRPAVPGGRAVEDEGVGEKCRVISGREKRWSFAPGFRVSVTFRL